MRYCIIAFCLLFITACQSQSSDSNKITFKDYLQEKELFSRMSDLDCDSVLLLSKKIRSVDFEANISRLLADCNYNIERSLVIKNDEKLLIKLGGILNDDQNARAEFDAYKANNPGRDYEIDSVGWYALVHKVDSINAIKLTSVVDDLGEWPGAKYIERSIGNPKLEVLVGHFPDEAYTKYSKMAFESASQGEEYWSRVYSMVGFSYTNPIIKEFYLNSAYIVPFRFQEFDKSNQIIYDETKIGYLELYIIAKWNGQSSSGNVIILSSIDDEEQRKALVLQTKQLLIQQGIEESNLQVDFEKYKGHEDFKLFYQIVN